ncbi:hypothetical protein H257_06408 [Aphanomyces astaci]|uniref:ribose-phosphate diphosphokinase n=1 Tax=Aphanomyces astaci TaxID=112090 RepID=W4GMN5_APHAT|nr:hypothetical protein H257_06408 [Aphanomyces astaci]ETV80965.1 hypothetical protein H257_06408 [Aphanomyces astaci]RHZ13888.1 hypothetical protein DYB31_002996 [Aphanomyces astaci]|eukprot:XP_009829912.1 hypothetical protein H257_06408 [Aphanomyces astaci]
MFLRQLGRSKAIAAASLGLACGMAASSPASYSKDSLTTKRWHFYKGKMHPNIGNTVKLFKCDDTPIADEIAEYLGIKLSDMSVSRFADGETSIQVNENVRGQRVYIVSSTITVDRIMELLLSIAAMRRASAKTIVAVIPFYGYARQDMVSKGRGPISAADLARMLEEMGVDHVVTVDLHSSQIEGFFKPEVPVDNLNAAPVGSVFFSEQNIKHPCVVAPHASAVRRSLLFRDTLQRTYDTPLPMAIVVKKHILDRSTPGELVGDVEGKDCIVVDNLVDTGTSWCRMMMRDGRDDLVALGSTMIEVAKLLKSHGAATVSAFCVHGRFSSNAIDALNECKELDLIVTTDTIPCPSNVEAQKTSKIVTLSVAPFLAEAISCIHAKGSMSQKFALSAS